MFENFIVFLNSEYGLPVWEYYLSILVVFVGGFLLAAYLLLDE